MEVVVDIVDELIRGREAFGRREWKSARDRLSTVDLADLAPADLRALAAAAQLIGDAETCVRALQHSFQTNSESGDNAAAARDALLLTSVLETADNATAARGWLARAARLLESEPDDTVEHGYLLMHQMLEAVFGGRPDDAFAFAEQVVAAGMHHAEPDLVAMGRVCQGRMMIYRDRVPDGLALLDETMAGVAAGELSAVMAGRVYCVMIDACQELDDYRRMTDWTRMLTHWCEQQPDLLLFTGQSAVHRAQIMRVHGAWSDALDELDLAQARYEELGVAAAVGQVHYERGEVLRLQGNLDAAALAFAAASEQGHDPQPGLALMWKSQGRVDAASAALSRMLGEVPGPVHRCRLLPAVVEVRLAAGDVEGAAAAADELLEIASTLLSASASASAGAGYALGSVCLARDDPAAALPHLRSAWRAWLDLGARHDAARARSRIGLAFRAMDDEDSAAAELTVALRTFAELGAAPAMQEIERLLGAARSDGLTAREIEVLRLVAAGRSNAEIAVELFISDKTVARHLSNIFVKTDVTSRTAAAAYAFQHHLA